MGRISRYLSWRAVKNFFRAIYVEPLTLANMIPVAIVGTVQALAMLHKFKLMCYKDYECYANDGEFWKGTAEQRDYWEKNQMTNVNMVLMVINFPIAAAASVAWSAYSDRTGRQQPMLLGLTSTLWSFMGWAVILTTVWDASVWLKIPFTLLTALCGDAGLYYVGAQAFYADVIHDKEMVTIRMNVLGVLRTASQLVAFIPLMFLPDDFFSYERWMLISCCCIVLGFIYVLLRIPQIPPRELAVRERLASALRLSTCVEPNEIQMTDLTPKELELRDKMDTVSVDFEESTFNLKAGIKSFLNTYRDTYRAFKKPRVGHARFMVCAVALLQFISGMLPTEAQGGATIMTTYMIGKPHEWETPDLAQFNVIALVISSIGSLAGTFLFKKVFHLRDTTMILLSMVSGCACLVPVALAYEKGREVYVMWYANFFSVIAGIAVPTMMSFIAKLVPKHELGRIYVAFSTVGFVSGLIYGSLFTKIYNWSEGYVTNHTGTEWMLGLVWWIAIGFNVFCIFVMGIVHILAIKENVEHDPPAIKDAKEA